MKILVVGSWRQAEAEAVAHHAARAGTIIAQRGYELITGAGTGVSAKVVEAYRAAGGKRYTAILTSAAAREAVGEAIGPEPDTRVETDEDYPARNVHLVRACDAVLAFNGGLGTLSEIIHAVKDYNKRVALLESGSLAAMVRAIPELQRAVFLTDSVEAALEHLSKP